ncbi:MAG: Flp pilus assembly complex ATPase component TadA [Rubrivivax sp.]|jgi:type II secretory ATPase GspE/PulE/Tfp pilus assembly ATPase PilB-like protein|nr:Flp pilus assembly complex ATPase component TadA [Betaproteobacteria bacterium]MBP6318107.1 Flp pilus assembly complex ATPase component TadA [Rubrivivax sp.]MBK7275857.1 Flp pilus assembly complex ATPase component TadA [Betaproteobacteria bacterium]MBK7460791.1 Flp pilus assembly complex ATPase component TadA [Betaproteobacteria bacterium]MBK7516796.1 Flp pilus assembly complex ATPase component TadA [Betaproteobacteria bacterium]
MAATIETSTVAVAAASPPPAPSPCAASLASLWQALQSPPSTRAAHLGEALVMRSLLTPDLLAHALETQRQSLPHRLLGQMLVDAGVVTESQLDTTLAEWLGVRVVDARTLVPEAEALRRVPRPVAEREGVLPLMVRADTLVVAVPDPWDKRLLDELRFMSELKVVAVTAVPGTLAPAVARAYRSTGPAPAEAPAALARAAASPQLQRSLRELAAELASNASESGIADPAVASESDNTLVRLVNRLIAEAVEQRASDIHIETAEPPRAVTVRLRIDGELVRHLEVPASYRFALVARLKIMAELDISEHRKPQDGKIDFSRFGGPRIELRMVTVPTSRGMEDVVLRLLSSLKPMPLDGIGLSPANLDALRGVMHKAHGLILICGPTGCGKTTTLHSVMRELNTDRRKIWTAEDPIEITQEGLRQVQVNSRIGWTFAAAMRTFLRADPDVIMIGEMRDEETARIAVEASLTGHLVMSTLHTNSAPESITRLLEIGLDPFMFSDSLLAVLAQRLVRRLCPACRVAEPLDERALDALAQQYLQSSHGVGPLPAELVARWRREHGDAEGRLHHCRRHGCPQCEGTGYRGRIGLHELLLADEALREGVRHRRSAGELQAAGLAAGMVTLRQDGIEKVLAGHTDLAEVLAAANQ